MIYVIFHIYSTDVLCCLKKKAADMPVNEGAAIISFVLLYYILWIPETRTLDVSG